MKAAAYIAAGVLILLVLVPWTLRTLQAPRNGAAAVGLAVPVASSTASTANLPNGFVSLDGTAILDTSSGLPAVPFIAYTDSNGRMRTKQLIFANERGCLPNAGDLPCVPTYPVLSAYPKLRDGERIHAEGYVRDDRLLLTALSKESER